MRSLFALLIALLLAAPATATIIPLTAHIDGGQVVPPTDSIAFGTLVGSYDDVANVLSWTVLFTDSLLDIETGSAIHGPAPVGSNAPFKFSIGTGSLKQGMLDFDFVSACSADPEACEAQLLAGLWYVLVSSLGDPDGEIRGQINPETTVPEPIALSMLTMGIGGLALFGERRRV